jgi:hypothetical protein
LRGYPDHEDKITGTPEWEMPALRERGGIDRRGRSEGEIRERKWGGRDRHEIWRMGKKLYPRYFKVPRQCTLVLLVELMQKIGIIFSRR